MTESRCPSRVLAVALLGATVMATASVQDGSPGAAPATRHLLLVLDGLRPDYVTPDLMPVVHALGERGVVFERHHAVYPTVTRVNAASISTGAYPTTHGLMGNAVFFPAVDAARFLDTGNRENLLAIEATEPALLTAPTLGEGLQAAGLAMLVVSAGSSGSSYLLHHTVASGGIVHYDYTLPPTLADRVDARLGPPPTATAPAAARNRYAVDALLDVGWPVVDPAVTVLWLTEPDTTAHGHGVGTPATVEAIRTLDTEIGRILDWLDDHGLRDRTNVWVTSDHGFSTHTGGPDLDAILTPLASGLEAGAARLVRGAGAVYVRDGDRRTVSAIADVLQTTPGVGAIFTAPATAGSLDGWVPGTLSFNVARWMHARAADILFSPDWSDTENEHGYAGTAAQNGVAGHGSSSPFDIHSTLLAAGPSLRSGVRSRVPTGNVDFAPTFLWSLELARPASMEGRVIEEAFRGGPEPREIPVRRSTHSVERADGRYRVTAVRSTVAGHDYLDQTEVVRTP